MVPVNDNEKNGGSSLKFLCSYGGKILLRSNDGKLRYVGGLTRVLSVHRSISFEELMVKLSEFCGYSVDLRCQLPNGDLETLISVKSDEDLANIVEEYNRISGAKIRAILSPPKSNKYISPRSSGEQSPSSPFSVIVPSPPNSPAFVRFPRYSSPPTNLPRRFIQKSQEPHCCTCHVHKNNKVSRLIWQ